MITGLSHVSIVVPSLESAAGELEKKYGLRIGPVLVNEQQGVRMTYVELPNAKIELMEPLRADSPVGRFLQRNPRGGIHHLSLRVDSVQATVVALEHKGGRVLGEATQKNVHGARIAFVHPHDFLGALVELEEQRN